jgi:uncharacterized repeat protein (TIGR01451 family)
MRYGVLRGRLAVRAAIVAGAAALLGAGVPAGMASTSADGEADLSVTVSASADQVTAGGTVDYRITVADHGPGDAARVRLHVVLPDSFQFVAASGARICTSDGAVDCVIGEVPHGTTATVDVQARTSAAGTFGTSATVSSPWVDTKPDDNTARATTTVLGSARLVVIEKVTNDDGGTAAPRDFGVRVDGA